MSGVKGESAFSTRRSEPFTPRRRMYAGVWVKVRHFCAFAHTEQATIKNGQKRAFLRDSFFTPWVSFLSKPRVNFDER
jgi:hypothetical protein